MRFSDRIIVGLSSDCRRIVFLLAEAIHGVSAEVLNLQISWQAQYLVSVCCLTLKKKVAFGVGSKEQNFINLKFNSKATYTIDISTKVINTSINQSLSESHM